LPLALGVGAILFPSTHGFRNPQSNLPIYTWRKLEAKLQPGMPAIVFVRTGDQSPFDYLMKPLTNSMPLARGSNDYESPNHFFRKEFNGVCGHHILWLYLCS